MNPYLIVIALVALLAAAGGGYGVGYDHAANACEAARAKAVDKALVEYKARASQQNKVAEKLEVDDAKADAVYRTITKTVDRVVERPVYRNVCLDADGLRNVNAALAGAAANPGQPDGVVR